MKHTVVIERASSAPFRDYVRGVLAERSERWRALRARRMRWLRRVGQRVSLEEARWENEGGSMW
jgi:hypothetical protein